MIEVRVEPGVNGFAENKDQAKELRIHQILPALEQGSPVILDFAAVKYATQSFVHALIGEALQRQGEQALELTSSEIARMQSAASLSWSSTTRWEVLSRKHAPDIHTGEYFTA